MSITPTLLPEMIQAIDQSISDNAKAVTALDQEIGDGDHVFNLQRGLVALNKIAAELTLMDWSGAWNKIGMTLMASVGGASGSLYGTFFMAMSKAVQDRPLDLKVFAECFAKGVESVKNRGKADAGQKTMLDVLIPVAEFLQQTDTVEDWGKWWKELNDVAINGVESTRSMLATKGRASYLGERSLGHIDAGAKTSQLMIAAIASVLMRQPQ